MKSSPHSHILLFLMLTLMMISLAWSPDSQAQSTQSNSSATTTQATETTTTHTRPMTHGIMEEDTSQVVPAEMMFSLGLALISLFIILALIFTGWFNREHWSQLADRGKLYAYYDAPVLLALLLASTVVGILLKEAPPVYMWVPEGETPGPKHNLYQSLAGLLQFGLMIYVTLRLILLMFSSWTGIERSARPLFAETADEFGFGLGPSPNSTFLHVVLGTPACIVIAMATGSVIALSMKMLGIHTPEVAHETLKQLKANPQLIVTVIITAVIIVPVFEEILFRLFLQGALSKMGLQSRPWVVILVASAIFAVMHAASVQWVAIFPLFILGICFGAVYERTGSIVPPILMHMGFNGANVAIVWSQIQNP